LEKRQGNGVVSAVNMDVHGLRPRSEGKGAFSLIMRKVVDVVFASWFDVGL